MIDKKNIMAEENIVLFISIPAILVILLFLVNECNSKKNSSIIQKNISYNIYSLKGKDSVLTEHFFLERGRLILKNSMCFFQKMKIREDFLKIEFLYQVLY